MPNPSTHRTGVSPHYVRLNAPGRYQGVSYQLALEHGELVCYIGGDRYHWRMRNQRMQLVRYDGVVYHNAAFVAHVDRIADAALDRIGS